MPGRRKLHLRSIQISSMLEITTLTHNLRNISIGPLSTRVVVHPASEKKRSDGISAFALRLRSVLTCSECQEPALRASNWSEARRPWTGWERSTVVHFMDRIFRPKVTYLPLCPTERSVFLAIRAYVENTETASRHYSQLSSMKRFMSKSGSRGPMRSTCS